MRFFLLWCLISRAAEYVVKISKSIIGNVSRKQGKYSIGRRRDNLLQKIVRRSVSLIYQIQFMDLFRSGP